MRNREQERRQTHESLEDESEENAILPRAVFCSLVFSVFSVLFVAQ